MPWALPPRRPYDGWLVIIRATYPSTPAQVRQPESRLPLQTGFEEVIWGNVIPTQEDQERLLREAGFTGQINRSLRGDGSTFRTTQRGVCRVSC